LCNYAVAVELWLRIRRYELEMPEYHGLVHSYHLNSLVFAFVGCGATMLSPRKQCWCQTGSIWNFSIESLSGRFERKITRNRSVIRIHTKCSSLAICFFQSIDLLSDANKIKFKWRITTHIMSSILSFCCRYFTFLIKGIGFKEKWNNIWRNLSYSYRLGCIVSQTSYGAEISFMCCRFF